MEGWSDPLGRPLQAGGSDRGLPSSLMPQPGDTYAQAFVVDHTRCWRMVHDSKGQATHCAATPSWTGGGSPPPATGGGASDGAEGIRVPALTPSGAHG